MKKYQVSGGKYRYTNYGGSDTLRGAKIIASRNEEKALGLSIKPRIYLASDCVECMEKGKLVPYPLYFANPVCVWDGKTWEHFAPVFGEM